MRKRDFREGEVSDRVPASTGRYEDFPFPIMFTLYRLRRMASSSKSGAIHELAFSGANGLTEFRQLLSGGIVRSASKIINTSLRATS